MKNVLARSFDTPHKLLVKRRADHGHSAGRSSAKRGGSGSAGARGTAPARLPQKRDGAALLKEQLLEAIVDSFSSQEGWSQGMRVERCLTLHTRCLC